jgi:hypothetical protein
LNVPGSFMALRRVFVFGEWFYRRDAEGAEKGEKINTEKE